MPIPPVALPLGLTLFRLALGPVMVLVAWVEPDAGPWLAAGLVPAILSDLFDGIVARRRGVATPALRRLDSQTDLVFWLCVLGCIAILHPAVVRRHGYLIVVLLALEGSVYAISFARFGREPCTHAYSARVWGVFLVGCLGAALGWGEDRFALPLLFGTYLVSWVDVVLILLLLPAWRTDVPSFWHALRARRGREVPANG
jgi:phosphatidylglycerophosphate synthase